MTSCFFCRNGSMLQEKNLHLEGTEERLKMAEFPLIAYLLINITTLKLLDILLVDFDHPLD